MDFLKKYIHLAKSIQPQLTKKASERIADEYARLRNMDQENTDIARVRFDICFVKIVDVLKSLNFLDL